MKKSDDNTLVDALRILSRDIQSGDGIANACIFEAAQRLGELIKALYFYANRANYNNHTSKISNEESLIDDDGGKLAREVLGL